MKDTGLCTAQRLAHHSAATPRCHWAAAALCVLLAAGCDRPPPPWSGPDRGIVIDPFRARPVQADFDSIAALGASHIGLFVWATMESHTSPRILRFDRGEGPLSDWSFSDDAFVETARMARRAGLRLVVLPTFADFTDGHWRGEARMQTESDWSSFFAQYNDFVLHYAELADRHGAAGFSVGTELRETLHRPEWLTLIDDVRKRFGGWITYAANWDDYDQVPWWDTVDRIGIQAYFELGSPRDSIRANVTGLPLRRAMREGLANAWFPIRASIAALADSVKRPVLFTEIGYKSHSESTQFPWDWALSGTLDTLLQAEAYEAAFEVFSQEPWFDGFYWWKWHPASDAEDRSLDFSPRGKPAAEVLRRRWR